MAGTVIGSAPLAVSIRGRSYPVLLPKLRDPRLHLAATIVSLQVLGQVGLGFRVSIAQILIALGTCAVLEVAIAARRDGVLMWPASALITGNGVAFILRVPGTEHGDWWSTNGGWIYAGTAAVALLSKYAIRIRGAHVFNPSNLGLVLCFLVLGSDRAEPLDFWWGPVSPALVLALAIIFTGGLVILHRLGLLFVAATFWATFAAGVGVLALSDHAMTASWHLGAITGWDFWWTLVGSPEIFIFLFFMITDPKTIPASRTARVAYAVAVGLLAVLLIAPQQQEFGTKVALLGALSLVCLAQSLARVVRIPRPRFGLALGALPIYAAVLILAGGAARGTGTAAAFVATTHVDGAGGPAISIKAARDIATKLEPAVARSMAHDVVGDLDGLSRAVRRADADLAERYADAAWLLSTQKRIDGGRRVAPDYAIRRIQFTLARRPHQMMPAILATVWGSAARAAYTHTFEIALRGRRYLLVTDDLPPGWRP